MALRLSLGGDPVGSGCLLQHTRPARDELHVVESALALVAHVLSGCVNVGLEIPEGWSSLDQGRVDESAATLRAQDILADLLQIPTVVGFFDEERQDLGGLSSVGQSWCKLGWTWGARGSRRGEGVVS